MLWLFQTVFLNEFYKTIKSEQIKDTGDDIADVISDKDTTASNMQEYLNEVVTDSDYCVRVLDSNWNQVYQNVSNNGVCGFMTSDTSELTELYLDALDNDGSYIKITEGNGSNVDKPSIPDGILNNNDSGNDSILRNHTNFKTMTYVKIVSGNDGTSYTLLVNAKITLMGEVVSTLRTQLLIVTGILLLLSLIMAFLISKRIAKPIAVTNESAKQLAQGNLQVEFKGKGYLEIEELNDTLNYAASELSKVDGLRNELIANISHDFRTPLTMIAGYSEAIRDLPDENTPENIQVIIDECARLTTLVNDLLDLSKLQSKNQKINMEPFDITEMIKNICNRFNTMLVKEKYEIIFDYDSDIFVIGDEIRMNQVVYNIIGNATHYTGPDNKVYIRQIDKGDKVLIEIEDTGKGIKAEDLPYVWDRYYHKQKVTKRQTVGTGIGLSIVKGILELHKAVYGVKSEPGKGATFYFELDKSETKRISDQKEKNI